MSADTSRRLRVVEGRPWQQALVCALAPEAPYQPWHGVDGLKPGDAVIVIVATEPPTVLCGFRVGAEPVRQAIAASARSVGSSLRTVDEVERAAGGHRLTDGLPAESAAAAALIRAVNEYAVSKPAHRLGMTALAAGRILLDSGGRCTCCRMTVDLAHTAVEDLALHQVSEPDFLHGRDWPALLCPKCAGEMARGGFDSVTDYAYSLRPACPSCSARRTRDVTYGMPAVEWHLNMPSWISGGGCVVGSRGRWACGECGHTWGEAAPFGDITRSDAARKLFAAWTGVTNPELLAALWNNLNADDRRFWLDRAGE